MNELEKRLYALAHKNLPQLERWEIAREIEPLSAVHSDNKSALNLTLVVDEESLFILNARVSHQNKKDSGIDAFLEAIERHKVIPQIILVPDQKLYDELAQLIPTLKFVLTLKPRLKAIPIVLQDVRRMLSAKQHNAPNKVEYKNTIETFEDCFNVIINGDPEASRMAARQVRKILYSAKSNGQFDNIHTIIKNAPEEYARILDELR